MQTITQQNATPGQIKQIMRFSADAIERVLEELDLNKPSVQRVIEHGDEFVSGLREAVTVLLRDLSISDRFSDEEVESSDGYLSGYKPKHITEQVSRLRELFPNLGTANEKLAEAKLPTNAEGWFAIPRWEKIAPTYNEAVSIVLDLIKQTRDGEYVFDYGEEDLSGLKPTVRTESQWSKIAQKQHDHDILVVSAQFGLRHRGRSIRRAREVFTADEFGLGAFAIGIMLLTHPERLMNFDDLWVYCLGDEESTNYTEDCRVLQFSPFFRFTDQVVFGSDWTDEARSFNGSASAFVP